jgi:hypothetical protein
MYRTFSSEKVTPGMFF